MKRASLFKSWSLAAMGHRTGSQKAARAVAREAEEITHDKLWGLKPEMFYTGKVIRRPKAAVA